MLRNVSYITTFIDLTSPPPEDYSTQYSDVVVVDSMHLHLHWDKRILVDA